MQRTLEVTYDGKVLLPETPLDLEPNRRYTISIEDENPTPSESESAWDVLHQLAGTVEGPGDWAAEHDHYLYGTPKRALNRTPEE